MHTGLYIFPGEKGVDFELFIRPLTIGSWWIIFLAAILLMVGSTFPRWFISGYNNTNGYRIVGLFAGGFCLLLNAYYGGAMTMFFTTEMTLPFNSIYDVFKDDNWKVIFRAGSENHFFKKVKVDKAYAKYWERVQSNKEDYTYGDMYEGIELASQKQVVVFAHEDAVGGFFSDRVIKQKYSGIRSFDKKAHFWNWAVAYKSPLISVFGQSLSKLRERGILQFLLEKYLPSLKKEPHNRIDDLNILSLRQISALFMFVGCMYFLSLIILGSEVYLNTYNIIGKDFMKKFF